MTDRKKERPAPVAHAQPNERDTHHNPDSADDPEFRGYRPNLPGSDKTQYRGPEQGSDPRPQSADDPEFKTYRPSADKREASKEPPAPAGEDGEDDE